MSFFKRAEAIEKGISPSAKLFLPGALIALLLDMCKALDKLTKENEK